MQQPILLELEAPIKVMRGHARNLHAGGLERSLLFANSDVNYIRSAETSMASTMTYFVYLRYACMYS